MPLGIGTREGRGQEWPQRLVQTAMRNVLRDKDIGARRLRLSVSRTRRDKHIRHRSSIGPHRSHLPHASAVVPAARALDSAAVPPMGVAALAVAEIVADMIGMCPRSPLGRRGLHDPLAECFLGCRPKRRQSVVRVPRDFRRSRIAPAKRIVRRSGRRALDS
jgi:hypothetical protein